MTVFCPCFLSWLISHVQEYEAKLKQEEDGFVDEDMDARRAEVAKFLSQVCALLAL